MAPIPKPEPRTLAALDAAMEAAQDTTSRTYLGVSQIGHPCERHLFYSFRWAADRRLPAKSLRAIEDGFAGEDVMAKRLRLIPGIELHTEDDTTGQQFAVSQFGGHLQGHLDGAISGVLEAPKTWHVWEHKQVNADKFKKLGKLIETEGEKAALKAWDSVYHGQAMYYMGMTDMDRHFMTVGSPGGREYLTVRTDFDRAEFARLQKKAERVITSDVPPPRLSDDPAYFECKWCSYYDVCHGALVPRVNCRTCAHATPDTGGSDATWVCAQQRGEIRRAAGKPHECHRFIPILLEKLGKPIDSDGDSVTYQAVDGRQFVNGAAPGFTSAEIAVAGSIDLLASPTVKDLKNAYPTAKVVAGEPT